MFSLRSLRFSRLALPRSFHTIRPSYAMKESDISMLPHCLPTVRYS